VCVCVSLRHLLVHSLLFFLHTLHCIKRSLTCTALFRAHNYTHTQAFFETGGPDRVYVTCIDCGDMKDVVENAVAWLGETMDMTVCVIIRV
jgi:hypothetical protein